MGVKEGKSGLERETEKGDNKRKETIRKRNREVKKSTAKR